jgi:hypothetical protein
VTGDAVLVAAERGQDAIAYAALPKAINATPASLSAPFRTGKVNKTFFMTTCVLRCCKDQHGDKHEEGAVYEGTEAFEPLVCSEPGGDASALVPLYGSRSRRGRERRRQSAGPAPVWRGTPGRG